MRQIFLTILFLGTLVAVVFGQGGKGPWFQERGGMMGSMHHHMEDWTRRLNLSEEQTARLQELCESYLRDTLGWRNEVVIKRFDLRDLLRNPQADPNQVLAKQREISELESKIQERTVLYQLEMRRVLTSEQIKLLPPGFGFGGFRGQGMMRGRGRGMGRE